MIVVTVGELVVDWISTQKGASVFDAGSFFRYLGGNASNVAIALERLGTKARLVGKIGNDVHGHYLMHALNAHGLDTRFIISDGRYPTAQCYAFWDRGDDYSFYNWPKPHAADMLDPTDITESILDDAIVLHATGISLSAETRRSAVMKLMHAAHDAGVFLSFDACFPGGENEIARAGVRDAMQLADLLKVNYNELIFWSEFGLPPHSQLNFQGNQLPKELINAARTVYAESRPALLAVTLGEWGSLLVTGDSHVYCSSYPVETVAAIGAGDAYVAGLIHKIVEMHRREPRKSPTAVLRGADTARLAELGFFANAVGALATRSLAACDGLPRLQEVNALMNA